MEADGDTLGDALLDGLTLLLGDRLGEADDEGLTLALGLTEELGDPVTASIDRCAIHELLESTVPPIWIHRMLEVKVSSTG